MFQAMARRFACYVNGKQYDFETFFYKDDETICVCSVSTKHIIYLKMSWISFLHINLKTVSIYLIARRYSGM